MWLFSIPFPVLKVIMAGWLKPAQFLAAISTSYRLSGCSLVSVSLCKEPEMLLDVHSADGSPTCGKSQSEGELCEQIQKKKKYMGKRTLKA